MKFIRFGNLNATDYGTTVLEGKEPIFGKETFHAPPVRRGIFAFPYPYNEIFLWGWKVGGYRENETEEEYKKRFNKYYREQKKIFEYNGPIWTHIEKHGALNNGSWFLVDTSELEKLLKKDRHVNIVSGAKAYYPGYPIDNEKKLSKEQLEAMLNTKDPYKRGLCSTIMTCADHLEVFIEKNNLGKIK